MIIYALTYRAYTFRGRRGIWLIDNVASLMCLIRGRSHSPYLERMCGLIHAMLYALANMDVVIRGGEPTDSPLFPSNARSVYGTYRSQQWFVSWNFAKCVGNILKCIGSGFRSDRR